VHVLGAPTDGEGMGRTMERASRELQPLVFTPEEVAKLLCVSRYTVYRLIEQGNLPTVRIGRLRRVRKVDLERWIEEHLSSAS
jgi:excisionase family DNA binding protein